MNAKVVNSPSNLAPYHRPTKGRPPRPDSVRQRLRNLVPELHVDNHVSVECNKKEANALRTAVNEYRTITGLKVHLTLYKDYTKEGKPDEYKGELFLKKNPHGINALSF